MVVSYSWSLGLLDSLCFATRRDNRENTHFQVGLSLMPGPSDLGAGKKRPLPVFGRGLETTSRFQERRRNRQAGAQLKSPSQIKETDPATREPPSVQPPVTRAASGSPCGWWAGKPSPAPSSCVESISGCEAGSL